MFTVMETASEAGEVLPSVNAVEGVNENAPPLVAVVLPICVLPSNIFTVEDASALPAMAGLLLLVEEPVTGDVITGLAGAVKRKSKYRAKDPFAYPVRSSSLPEICTV